MADKEFGIETLCLHAGQIPDAVTGSRAVPIYQTASYVFDDPNHAASLFDLQTFGNVYTRMMNPTTSVFEERMAALENGRAALAVSSGMAAQMVALLTLMEAGDELLSATTLYGGTYSQFDVTFRKFGINVVFVNPDDPDNFRRALSGKTKAIYAETVGNPLNNILDLEAVAAVANEAGVPLVIDNTFASPLPVPPHGLRRRYRHALRHQVHRRARHLDRWGAGRIGPVRLDQRQVPRHDRTVQGLSRRAFL